MWPNLSASMALRAYAPVCDLRTFHHGFGPRSQILLFFLRHLLFSAQDPSGRRIFGASRGQDRPKRSPEFPARFPHPTLRPMCPASPNVARRSARENTNMDQHILVRGCRARRRWRPRPAVSKCLRVRKCQRARKPTAT